MANENPLQVECCRCGAVMPRSEFPGCTEGYYDVSAEPWSRFAGSNERIICDMCMHDNAEYKSVYGWRK